MAGARAQAWTAVWCRELLPGLACGWGWWEHPSLLQSQSSEVPEVLQGVERPGIEKSSLCVWQQTQLPLWTWPQFSRATYSSPYKNASPGLVSSQGGRLAWSLPPPGQDPRPPSWISGNVSPSSLERMFGEGGRGLWVERLGGKHRGQIHSGGLRETQVGREVSTEFCCSPIWFPNTRACQASP